MVMFNDVFIDDTKNGRKIPKEEYLAEGLYPIIDQGQEYIAGYSNGKSGIYENVPVVIFGDHTRIIKYVDIPFFLGADGVKILKVKGKEVNHKYFYYALSNARIPDTGYNRHFKWLKELDFNLADKEKQVVVVEVLDKLNSLIMTRKQQLQKLDELIKARFIEMFGDPVTNIYSWEQTTLKDICIGNLTYGSGASACEFDGRIRYIRITDINETGALNSERVSPSLVESKYILNEGDILFARSGATVGKTYRYKNTDGICLYAGYLIRLIPDISKVLPDYIFHYTKTNYYNDFISSNMKVVAQPNINAQQYGGLIICVPPMELQKKLVDFVKQIDKSKLSVQKSLEKLETLKKALMQKYFG